MSKTSSNNTLSPSRRRLRRSKYYQQLLEEVIDQAFQHLSEMKPSEWCEENRLMTSDVSPLPGMFSYENSPYTKEIADCAAPDHPARVIAVMKGAQIGFSTSVIEAVIGWIISQNPGNILFLVGHDDLVKDAMAKVDRMIDSTGIRELIKVNTLRKRNTKSGDTDTRKDFAGGYLKLGVANHKTLRNISMKYGFIDDFESMRHDSKESGSTAEMIEQRFAAFASQMKLYYISTPEQKETSNIEPVYLMGDQRKYHIPCPCCGEYIRLEWEIASEVEGVEMAGMYWETDKDGRLLPETVGYICYKCDGWFDDSNKMELIRLGEWIPTAEPQRPGYYSYHISALYAPTYMFGWEHYVRKYMEAHPHNQPRDEEKWHTFQNLVLGHTYSPTASDINAAELQKNCRRYMVGTVPEKQSIADGNGKIVLLTLAADVNGKEDDARLDWEVVAWSEKGQSYSVDEGSIGTFIIASKDRGEDRKRWTYRRGGKNNVWDEFEKIRLAQYKTDTGTAMRILITGVDSGYLTDYVYSYVDNCNGLVYSLKGKDENKYLALGVDRKLYKASQEKKNLYLVEANVVKDQLAANMGLKWDSKVDEQQPHGFMNFPQPGGGKYTYNDYFSHFEAEHKILDKQARFRWVKKTRNAQNHKFDCRLYNMAIRDILVDKVLKEAKIVNGVWADFAEMIVKIRK